MFAIITKERTGVTVDADVLIVSAVVGSPGVVAAVEDAGFRAVTLNVIQPDRVHAGAVISLQTRHVKPAVNTL